jgi:hypothetical protein
MIREVFLELIPRINDKFKELFYVTDDEGHLVLNDVGQALQFPKDGNQFKLKYKYSSPDEWIDEVIAGQNEKAGKFYPFLFINSIQVKEEIENNVYTLGEIVLVAKTKIKDNLPVKDGQLDDLVFKPVLNQLYRIFYDSMELSRSFSIVKHGERTDHRFYDEYGLKVKGKGKYPDKVSAIEINNLQIRTFKKC